MTIFVISFQKGNTSSRATAQFKLSAALLPTRIFPREKKKREWPSLPGQVWLRFASISARGITQVKPRADALRPTGLGVGLHSERWKSVRRRGWERGRDREITWQQARIRSQMKLLHSRTCERIHTKAWIKRIRGQKPWFAGDFWDSHWLPDRRYQPLWALRDKLQNSPHPLDYFSFQLNVSSFLQYSYFNLNTFYIYFSILYLYFIRTKEFSLKNHTFRRKDIL